MDVLVPVVKAGIDSITALPSEVTSEVTSDSQRQQRQYHFSVDLYLVLGYQLSSDRKQKLRSILPTHVGIEIWDDATPLYYEFSTAASSKPANRRVPFLGKMSRTLARQHRYVVKDKLPYYDVILAMEDDMLVTRNHIMYHLQFRHEQSMWINHLQKQQQQQQQQQHQKSSQILSSSSKTWWDSLSIEEWKRLYPAWIRVEVVTNSTSYTEQNDQNVLQKDSSSVVVDDEEAHTTLTLCCYDFAVSNANDPSPLTSDQLVVWETGIAGLSVRRLPPPPPPLSPPSGSIGFRLFDALRRLPVLTQWSPSQSSPPSVENGHNNTILKPSEWIALIDPASAVDASSVPRTVTELHRHRRTLTGYWSGSYARLVHSQAGGTSGVGQRPTGYDKPPSSRENHFFANPAGWIGTVRQIFDWHVQICPDGTFLPPLGSRSILSSSSKTRRRVDDGVGRSHSSAMAEDGMDSTTDYVEYWSGGMQLFGQSTCAVQRILNIDRFNQHLIYHTANNKQHDLPVDRFVTATSLWRQLKAVRIDAEKDFTKYRPQD